VDSQGNVYISWEFTRREFGYSTGFIKLDNDGDILFSISFDESTPHFLVDSNDNIYPIYIVSAGQLQMGYIKLSNNGNIIEKKNVSTNNSHILHISSVIDANNNLHICSIGSAIYHTIINENGEIINDFNLTPYVKENSLNKYLHSVIDVDLNLHVFWDNGVKSYGDDINKKNGSKIYYLKQLSNGTVAINATLTISNTSILRANDVVTDSENNVYIFWDEYSTEPFYGPGLHDPIHSYLEKLDFNGSLIYKKEITAMAVTDACMDANNNIHVVGTTGATGGYPDNDNGVYLKLDSDGDVLVGPVQFTNKVMSQSGRLAVDSVGNVHIVWHGKETRWKSYPMTTYEEPVDYYTVYYSKLDSNDNIIIDEKVIDADEKPEDTMFSSLCLVMIGIIIVVATVITIVLLVRRKKQTKQQRDEHVG
jgi:hypothetical protein